MSIKCHRMQELTKELGASRSTIYRWQKEEGFPVGRQLGRRMVVYFEDEVKAWISNRNLKSQSIGTQ